MWVGWWSIVPGPDGFVRAQATRSVHPDKLTSDVGVEEKLLCVRIFSLITEEYTKFKC